MAHRRGVHLARSSVEFLRPLARAVEDGQYLNVGVADAVGHDEGRIDHDQFARVGEPGLVNRYQTIATAFSREACTSENVCLRKNSRRRPRPIGSEAASCRDALNVDREVTTPRRQASPSLRTGWAIAGGQSTKILRIWSGNQPKCQLIG